MTFHPLLESLIVRAVEKDCDVKVCLSLLLPCPWHFHSVLSGPKYEASSLISICETEGCCDFDRKSLLCSYHHNYGPPSLHDMLSRII